jgi:hypothetical protein
VRQSLRDTNEEFKRFSDARSHQTLFQLVTEPPQERTKQDVEVLLALIELRKAVENGDLDPKEADHHARSIIATAIQRSHAEKKKPD